MERLSLGERKEIRNEFRDVKNRIGLLALQYVAPALHAQADFSTLEADDEAFYDHPRNMSADRDLPTLDPWTFTQIVELDAEFKDIVFSRWPLRRPLLVDSFKGHSADKLKLRKQPLKYATLRQPIAKANFILNRVAKLRLASIDSTDPLARFEPVPEDPPEPVPDYLPQWPLVEPSQPTER